MDTNKFSFVNLPLELVYHIVSFVRVKKDQLALCGTSTIIRGITLPRCFKTVDLVNHEMDWGIFCGNSWRTPAWRDQTNGLVKSLQNPRIALLVTDFRILICASSQFCTPGSSVCISCATMDTIVGDALLAMVNLEALYFVCCLCTWNVAGPHTYINKLPTKKLRTFYFECLCGCESLIPAQTKQFLSLPALATVEKFSYKTRISRYPLDLDGLSVLPLVRSLKYHASSLDDWIISNRPTTRWLSEAHGHLFSPRARQSAGTPTHLMADTIFPGILKDVAMTFQSLQHVGTFSTRKMRFAKVEVIACPPLKSVTSIDVNSNDPRSSWDEGKCVKIRVTFPLLRKVLVHGSTSAVWELQGEIWEMRKVDYFTQWDILCGDCDDL